MGEPGEARQRKVPCPMRGAGCRQETAAVGHVHPQKRFLDGRVFYRPGR